MRDLAMPMTPILPASEEVGSSARSRKADGRVLIGMLTPSSNTILEPMSGRILADLPEITAHFGRFPVTEISLESSALDQFDRRALLVAARLLADARVDVIAWNGTSGGWMGFDQDRALCQAIEQATRIPATSSILALDEVFRRTGVARYGLVTPYRSDVQSRIIANLGRQGFECATERHLDLQTNFEFSEIGEATIAEMIRAVARAAPDAITVMCTNMKGAGLVEAIETEVGIPVYDTVATAIWASVRIAGVDPRRIVGWGRLFRDVR